MFLIVASVGLLLFLTPGSAEFYATIFTLLIGIALLLLVILVVRRFSK